MDYRRVYWLCFLGAGLLFGLLNLADYTATGSSTELVMLAVAGLIVAVSAFAAARPERVGGPDELGLRFAIAVAALLLFLILAVQRLLGF